MARANFKAVETVEAVETRIVESIQVAPVEVPSIFNQQPQVFKPGIYGDLDIDEYHASGGISSTGISLILDCPYRYYYKYFLNKEQDSKNQHTANAYRTGRAVHLLALEPDKFDSTFYCMEQHVNLTTKVGKELYAQAQAEANGRDILRVDEWTDIKQIAEAVHTNPLWNKLKNRLVEHSIFWRAGIYDTNLKARPDIFTVDLVVDLKTTDNINTFEGSIAKYGYYRQAAMQLDALQQIDGKERQFVLLVVEKKAPYLTACFVLDDEALSQGRKDYLRGAEIYAECMCSNEWPSYSTEPRIFKLPKWISSKQTNEQADEDLTTSF